MKKRIGAVVVAAVALTAGVAMAIETGGRPFSLIVKGHDFGLYKVCDAGRAVYVAEGYGSYNSGANAISVVPNAPECQFGR